MSKVVHADFYGFSHRNVFFLLFFVLTLFLITYPGTLPVLVQTNFTDAILVLQNNLTGDTQYKGKRVECKIHFHVEEIK